MKEYDVVPVARENGDGTVTTVVYGGEGMNDPDDGILEKWSERHFGELALWRTIGQGVNIILSTIVIAKLFGWI